MRRLLEGHGLSETSEKKSRLLVWIKELRAPFFSAVILPTLLGASIAWSTLTIFNAALLILTLLGAISVNAGTNLVNDYFDFKSGCDSADTGFSSPFSGGSGLLPKGTLEPKKVYIASLAFFGLAGTIGVLLTLTRGWAILILGLVGVLSGYFYTNRLAPRGVGEVIVGLNCGPLVTLGSYFVQTQRLALEPIVASIPLGILILEVLWINEIPDIPADVRAGKTTLVSRIGSKRAADVFIILMVSTYASILLMTALSLIPILALLPLLTTPLAAKAIVVARKNYGAPEKLIPANAGTVFVHLSIGVLLIVAYLLTGFLAI